MYLLSKNSDKMTKNLANEFRDRVLRELNTEKYEIRLNNLLHSLLAISAFNRGSFELRNEMQD
jgi:argonaute-like protein implicated in RNA metabolism and viral defense